MSDTFDRCPICLALWRDCRGLDHVITRDICDMGATAGEIGVTLGYVAQALGETFVSGLPERPVIVAALKDLHEACIGIAALIAELERELS